MAQIIVNTNGELNTVELEEGATFTICNGKIVQQMTPFQKLVSILETTMFPKLMSEGYGYINDCTEYKEKTWVTVFSGKHEHIFEIDVPYDPVFKNQLKMMYPSVTFMPSPKSRIEGPGYEHL